MAPRSRSLGEPLAADYPPRPMPLPDLPGHTLRIVSEDVPPAEQRGFIFVRRLQARATFANGEQSEPFGYDCADRNKIDAVVVVPHYRDAAGQRRVVLRSALRPPVARRPADVCPVPEGDHLGELWEVPAGLVEPEERSAEGLRACAARELLEETGFAARPSDVQPLGPSTFPAPGVIAERHFYFHVEVDPARREAATEDGSALERHASFADVTLDEALAHCRAGRIEDAKTELALRRLAEIP